MQVICLYVSDKDRDHNAGVGLVEFMSAKEALSNYQLIGALWLTWVWRQNDWIRLMSKLQPCSGRAIRTPMWGSSIYSKRVSWIHCTDTGSVHRALQKKFRAERWSLGQLPCKSLHLCGCHFLYPMNWCPEQLGTRNRNLPSPTSATTSMIRYSDGMNPAGITPRFLFHLCSIFLSLQCPIKSFRSWRS